MKKTGYIEGALGHLLPSVMRALRLSSSLNRFGTLGH
jgi:hypothetical protein